MNSGAPLHFDKCVAGDESRNNVDPISGPGKIDTARILRLSRMVPLGAATIGQGSVFVKAVILCGGQGSRLREHTETRPKPMVEIAGRPILWHIMKLYAHHGITDFILCLGYKGHLIKDYFLNYQTRNSTFTLRLGQPECLQFHDSDPDEYDWSVTLAETGEHNMTGSRISQIARYLDPHDDSFCLTYGDGVADVDLSAVLKFHSSHSGTATVTGVRPPGRFGELKSSDSQVLAFNEKPQVSPGLINGGFFVLDRNFLDYLSDAPDCVLEGAPLESCAADGNLFVYEHTGFWQCMDTHRDWQQLNQLWSANRPPWKVWETNSTTTEDERFHEAPSLTTPRLPSTRSVTEDSFTKPDQGINATTHPTTTFAGAQRVLVTGHLGYIGSRMTPLLVAAGHDVVGLDSGFFGDCWLSPPQDTVPTICKDLREVTLSDLAGFDAIIHLAALSNDPLGDLDPELTYQINYTASLRLAKLAKQAGVRRFLFSSSCSMYGAAHGDQPLNETAEFAPITPYAKAKVLLETALHQLADRQFTPVSLRNATVYGYSPRLRADLVVNNLVGWAHTTGQVKILSDGTPWRPLIHVEDLSRVFLHLLNAPDERVHNRAFNVGRTGENYQVRQVADLVAQVLPGCQAICTGESGPEYRVDFSLLEQTFPELELTWNVESGIRELISAYRTYGFSQEHLSNPTCIRLSRIQQLLEKGQLDRELKWQTTTPNTAVDPAAVVA